LFSNGSSSDVGGAIGFGSLSVIINNFKLNNTLGSFNSIYALDKAGCIVGQSNVFNLSEASVERTSIFGQQ
jgi:hypothetical protein